MPKITRENFVNTIKFFKENERKKLKNLLSNKEALIKFLKNDTINDYLSREVNQVTFKNNHPFLIDAKNKEENKITDHYELKIYKYAKDACEKEWDRTDLVPYRFDATTPEWNLSGACTSYIKNIISELDKSAPDDIHVSTPCDIYDISRILNHYAGFTSKFKSNFPKEKLPLKSKPIFRFMLSPNYKDNHASTIISILDPHNKKVLVSLFLNSWSLSTYYDDIKYSFNMDNNIPFVDVSHHLQIDGNDANCALYGINFIQGLIDMLRNTSISEKSYALAKKIAVTMDGDIDAREQLIKIFQEDLKAYLNCYYTQSNKQQKSAEELASYHSRQRWEIGNKMLKHLKNNTNENIEEKSQTVAHEEIVLKNEDQLEENQNNSRCGFSCILI